MGCPYPCCYVMAAWLGKMPTTSVRRLISPISRPADWSSAAWPCARQGRSCRRALSLGLVHQSGKLGHLRMDLVGDEAPLRARRRGIVLGKGGGDEGRDDTPALPAGMRQHIAHEVHAAALPGGAEHLGNGGLDAFMGSRR